MVKKTQSDDSPQMTQSTTNDMNCDQKKETRAFDANFLHKTHLNVFAQRVGHIKLEDDNWNTAVLLIQRDARIPGRHVDIHWETRVGVVNCKEIPQHGSTDRLGMKHHKLRASNTRGRPKHTDLQLHRGFYSIDYNFEEKTDKGIGIFLSSPLSSPKPTASGDTNTSQDILLPQTFAHRTS